MSITTVQVVTLGCSKNTVDTEHLLAQLPEDRFRILSEDSAEYADFLLVNTCGFIGDAKEESVNVVLAAGQNHLRCFLLLVENDSHASRRGSPYMSLTILG